MTLRLCPFTTAIMYPGKEIRSFLSHPGGSSRHRDSSTLSKNLTCLAVKSASDPFSRARFISSTRPRHKQLARSNGRSLSCGSHGLNLRQEITSQTSQTLTLLSGSYDSHGEANDDSVLPRLELSGKPVSVRVGFAGCLHSDSCTAGHGVGPVER